MDKYISLKKIEDFDSSKLIDYKSIANSFGREAKDSSDASKEQMINYIKKFPHISSLQSLNPRISNQHMTV